MVKESIYYLVVQKMAFYSINRQMKGAMDVQDDYNRFIRRSIRQAQCQYEDIFADDDAMQENTCGCGMVMNDADMTNACGCEVRCKPMGEKCQKNLPVMVFIEMQPFGRMYNEAEGLCRGTLFPALDKPFTGRGGCR